MNAHESDSQASSGNRPAPGDHQGSLRLRKERRFSPFRPFRGSNRRRGGGRLVIASNRLPVVLRRDPAGAWQVAPAAGGLVTALDPVMRKRGGRWMGWPGASDVGVEELTTALDRSADRPPYELEAIELSETDRDLFYRGFSNEVLWPLFHGFPGRCQPNPRYWQGYRRVNRRFARAIASSSRWDDLVWVQDYHLLLVAKELRSMGVENELAFFLHTPFPPAHMLRHIPWHEELLKGLLSFDLIGFQTRRDETNFLAAVRHYLPDESAAPRGRATRVHDNSSSSTGVFPISIDFGEFGGAGASSEVTAREHRIRNSLGECRLILGVDRLDYSKGLPEKLRAFHEALEDHPPLRGSVILKQLVIPSRDRIAAYAETKDQIETLVRAINRKWGRSNWQPVHYRYGSWDRTELLAHYRAADVALVTPLRDGMNLVAKEYCATNGGTGVLVLSAFAGAAAELGGGGLLVDPTEPRAVAQAIGTACALPVEVRRERMTRCREAVRRHDVHAWVQAFLTEGLRSTGGRGPTREKSARSHRSPERPEAFG